MRRPYIPYPIPYILALSVLVGVGLASEPSRAQTAQAQTPPAWTAGAVWYQVFPERFRNGDPTNDPTWTSLEFPEVVPEDRWAVTPWTGDWYARADWEEAMGPDFYEHGVFHRRYGGDLQGVMDALPYLDSLGVTALYLNPVFYAPSLHKYDGASFHHIDPYFGPDPEGDLALIARENDTGRPADPEVWTWTAADRLFLALVDSVHARGMRIVIDGVFNHTGTRHWAFENVRRLQDASPYADWYEVLRWDDPATPDTSEFDWEGWWGYKGLPVFRDTADSTSLARPVEDYVVAITRRWMDPDGDGDPGDGIDGWRLDVAEEVPEAFWARWNALVRTINPEAYTAAEVWGPGFDFMEATGFSGRMNYYGFAFPIEDWIVDGQIGPEAAANQLRERFEAYAPAQVLGFQNLMASHDTDRLASMIVNAGQGDYDRAVSPRYEADYAVRAPNAEERAIQRMIVALQVTLPGAPMLYYGTEAGMWGADDPDDRKPMVWPHLTYAPECLDPRGLERACDPVAFDRDLFEFHRRAIALRRNHRALRRGTFAVLHADDARGTLAFERRDGAQTLLVAVNRSDAPQRIRARSDNAPYRPLTPVFASSGDLGAIPSLIVTLPETGDPFAELEVPARTVVVYREPVSRRDIQE